MISPLPKMYNYDSDLLNFKHSMSQDHYNYNYCQIECLFHPIGLDFFVMRIYDILNYTQNYIFTGP